MIEQEYESGTQAKGKEQDNPTQEENEPYQRETWAWNVFDRLLVDKLFMDIYHMTSAYPDMSP